MFTLPINAIATSAVAIGSSYKYNQKSMPIYELHRFARFPQGIPEGFDMEYLE